MNVLTDYLAMPLPPWIHAKDVVDNWQTSAWMRRAPGLGSLPMPEGDDHFD